MSQFWGYNLNDYYHGKNNNVYEYYCSRSLFMLNKRNMSGNIGKILIFATFCDEKLFKLMKVHWNKFTVQIYKESVLELLAMIIYSYDIDFVYPYLYNN